MAKKKNRVLNYFKDVKSELKKVVWPSFKQVKNNTLVVIVCVLIIGAFIWILDAAFSASFGRLIQNSQNQDAVVEQTAEPTDDATFSEEDFIAMLKEYGIGYDAEKGVYTDLETGAELSEEEVTERISATETTGEETTETNNAGTAE